MKKLVCAIASWLSFCFMVRKMRINHARANDPELKAAREKILSDIALHAKVKRMEDEAKLDEMMAPININAQRVDLG